MTTCARATGATPPSTTETGADSAFDEHGYELAYPRVREGVELETDACSDRLAGNRRVDPTDEMVGELVDANLLGAVLRSHPRRDRGR